MSVRLNPPVSPGPCSKKGNAAAARPRAVAMPTTLLPELLAGVFLVAAVLSLPVLWHGGV